MGLMLHCGADLTSLSDVATVELPDATSTWQPIPHTHLIGLTKRKLAAGGYTITEEAHALRNGSYMPEATMGGEEGYSAKGAHYFGLMTLKGPGPEKEDADHSLTMGLRNALDKSFAASVAIGSNVFVCDNMCFSGEIVLGRKHTANIQRDLPRLVEDAVSQLDGHEQLQDRRFDHYKGTLISDPDVHDLVIRALDVGAISASKIPALLHEWREPTLSAWRDEPKSCWKLHNAFTEVWKTVGRIGPVWRLPQRSKALHSVLDDQVAATSGVHPVKDFEIEVEF